MLLTIILPVALAQMLRPLLAAVLNLFPFLRAVENMQQFLLIFLSIFGAYALAYLFLLEKKIHIGMTALIAVAVSVVVFIINLFFQLLYGSIYYFIPPSLLSLIHQLLSYAVCGVGGFLVLRFLQTKTNAIPLASMSTGATGATAAPLTFNNNAAANHQREVKTMYCRNCGSEMNENAVVCVKCGAAKGSGNAFCPYCGKETNAGAAVCLNCGAALNNANSTGIAGEGAKSKLVAGLLGIFLGGWGIHNFYLGYTQKAIIQILLGTVGILFFFIGPMVSGIWGLIEGILILAGKINVDGKGNLLKD